MALTINHAFICANPDDPIDAALGHVLPSHWNDNLVVSGALAVADITGLQTALDGKQAAGSYATTSQVREKLTGDRTYYVSNTGSNSNDGLSTGTAFEDGIKALSVVPTIDFNGHQVIIQFLAGSYDEPLDIPVTVGQAATGDLIIRGDTTTPSNVEFTFPFGRCVEASGFGARAKVEGIKFNNSGTWALAATTGGYLQFSNIEFAATQVQIYAATNGIVEAIGPFTISASPGWFHIYCEFRGMVIIAAQTITLTGTPAWGVCFAGAYVNSTIRYDGCTFVGSATGKRYEASDWSVINTFGGGGSYFPGDVAGTDGGGTGLYR